MPDHETTIAAWRERMRAAQIHEAELCELEDHLRDEWAAWQEKGMDADQALRTAMARLGDPASIGDEFRRIGRPDTALSARPALRSRKRKMFRIILAALLGPYVLLMGLQFGAITVRLIQQRMSPYAPEAPAAFFPNLLVCCLGGLALWALWRKKPQVTPET